MTDSVKFIRPFNYFCQVQGCPKVTDRKYVMIEHYKSKHAKEEMVLLEQPKMETKRRRTNVTESLQMKIDLKVNDQFKSSSNAQQADDPEVQHNTGLSLTTPVACSLACSAMTQLQELRKELMDVKRQVEEIVKGISFTASNSEVNHVQSTGTQAQQSLTLVHTILPPNLDSIENKENTKPNACKEGSTVENVTALKDVSNLKITDGRIDKVNNMAGNAHEKNIDAKGELNQPDLRTIIQGPTSNDETQDTVQQPPRFPRIDNSVNSTLLKTQLRSYFKRYNYEDVKAYLKWYQKKNEQDGNAKEGQRFWSDKVKGGEYGNLILQIAAQLTIKQFQKMAKQDQELVNDLWNESIKSVGYEFLSFPYQETPSESIYSIMATYMEDHGATAQMARDLIAKTSKECLAAIQRDFPYTTKGKPLYRQVLLDQIEEQRITGTRPTGIQLKMMAKVLHRPVYVYQYNLKYAARVFTSDSFRLKDPIRVSFERNQEFFLLQKK